MDVSFQDLPDAEKRRLCPMPEPPSPGRDWRWWSLWLPPVCSSVGFFLFGIFGYGFTQVEQLPQSLITAMVISGAILLSLGGEVGTVSATWEILRRHNSGEGANRLDWCGLILSVCTSIATLILSWAWLQEADTNWSDWMKAYGPLCLGALAIGDFTVGCIEAGTYLGTYDKRRKRWERSEYRPWLKWMAEETGWARRAAKVYAAPTGKFAETPVLQKVEKSAWEMADSGFSVEEIVAVTGKPKTVVRAIVEARRKKS